MKNWGVLTIPYAGNCFRQRHGMFNHSVCTSTGNQVNRKDLPKLCDLGTATPLRYRRCSARFSEPFPYMGQYLRDLPVVSNVLVQKQNNARGELAHT